MKKLLNAFIGMLISAIFSLIVGYIIDKIRDKTFDFFKKKKFCPICGGNGYVISTGIDNNNKQVTREIQCSLCSKKKN